jgi:hypothetical protein
MADDQQDRTTSHAKSIDGLAEQESSLDRARALKAQFQQAQSQHQQAEQTKGSAQRGSQMVKADAPGPRPAPSGPIRAAVDKQAFDAKLQKERSAEAQKLESARKVQEILKSRQQPTQDHDRDRER